MKLSRIDLAQVSSLRGKPANWKQGTMSRSTNNDNIKTYNLKLHYVQKLFQNSVAKFMEE